MGRRPLGRSSRAGPVASYLWRKKLHLVWALPLAGVMILIGVDLRVSIAARGRLYDEAALVPPKPVAVVLGTAKYVDGRRNLFYIRRMRAAAELYRAGKVRGVIVSGDNSRKDYDEPSAMRSDLIQLGVPGEYVTRDYAGFRTFDSVVRAREVFGQRSFVVVSQRFHCERAIYLARCAGTDAVGFTAADVGGRQGLRVRLRETLARTKAVLDVNLLGTRPRYLGKPEVVTLRTSARPGR